MADFSKYGNPFLAEDSFAERGGSDRMTRSGVALWLVLLTGILLASASHVWSKALVAFNGFDFTTIKSVQTGTDSNGKAVYTKMVVNPKTGARSSVPEFKLDEVRNLMLIGCLGGFTLALIVIFNPQSAPFLAPIYAGLEGLAIGGVSAMYEVQSSGIAMQAAGATFIVMFGMLALFATGIFKVSDGFVGAVLGCMLGVLGIYIADSVLQSFFGSNIDFVHSNSWLGIGFSIAVCVLAALNFWIDFDTIEKGIKSGAPKYMNAYCAFGVMLTLVWQYLELLRLFSKFQDSSSDD